MLSWLYLASVVGMLICPCVGALAAQLMVATLHELLESLLELFLSELPLVDLNPLDNDFVLHLLLLLHLLLN